MFIDTVCKSIYVQKETVVPVTRVQAPVTVTQAPALTAECYGAVGG